MSLRRTAAVALVCAAACRTPAFTTAEPQGWITRLLVHQGRTYGCSQAGVFVRESGRLRWLYRPDERVHDFAIAGVGRHTRIITCGGVPGRYGRIAVVDLDGTVLEQCKVGRDLLYAVAVAWPFEAAVAGADGSVYAFVPDTDIVPQLVHEHTAAARCIALHPQGQWLASGGLDGLIRISSTPHATVADFRPELAKPLVLDDHTAGVECLAYSDDGALLASGARDGKVRVHDVEGRLLFTWYGPSAEVRDLVFDGPRIVAGFADGRIAVIDTRDRTGHVLDQRGPDPLFAICRLGAGRLLAAGATITTVSTVDPGPGSATAGRR